MPTCGVVEAKAFRLNSVLLHVLVLLAFVQDCEVGAIPPCGTLDTTMGSSQFLAF